MSHVKFIAKFQNCYFWQFFKICNWIYLVLTWDLMWITSMGNHGAVGGISKRRRSSSSFFLLQILSRHWCCSFKGQWNLIYITMFMSIFKKKYHKLNKTTVQCQHTDTIQYYVVLFQYSSEKIKAWHHQCAWLYDRQNCILYIYLFVCIL